MARDNISPLREFFADGCTITLDVPHSDTASNRRTFRLEEELGHGHFGITYRGFDLDLNRDVALKIQGYPNAAKEGHIHKQAQQECGQCEDLINIHCWGTVVEINHPTRGLIQHPTAVTQDREATMRQLRSEALLDMMLAGMTNNPDALQRMEREGYFQFNWDNIETIGCSVLELAQGVPLLSLRAPGRQRDQTDGLSRNQIVGIVERIGNALQRLHEHSFVHGDVKPENVVVDPKNNLVRLLDFSTLKREMQGVPMACSPYSPIMHQQATGRVTKYIDLYGLANIFYYLYTGNPPSVIWVLNVEESVLHNISAHDYYGHSFSTRSHVKVMQYWPEFNKIDPGYQHVLASVFQTELQQMRASPKHHVCANTVDIQNHIERMLAATYGVMGMSLSREFILLKSDFPRVPAIETVQDFVAELMRVRNTLSKQVMSDKLQSIEPAKLSIQIKMPPPAPLNAPQWPGVSTAAPFGPFGAPTTRTFEFATPALEAPRRPAPTYTPYLGSRTFMPSDVGGNPWKSHILPLVAVIAVFLTFSFVWYRVVSPDKSKSHYSDVQSQNLLWTAGLVNDRANYYFSYQPERALEMYLDIAAVYENIAEKSTDDPTRALALRSAEISYWNASLVYGQWNDFDSACQYLTLAIDKVVTAHNIAPDTTDTEELFKLHYSLAEKQEGNGQPLDVVLTTLETASEYQDTGSPYYASYVDLLYKLRDRDDLGAENRTRLDAIISKQG